jgi:hypothetical protein
VTTRSRNLYEQDIVKAWCLPRAHVRRGYRVPGGDAAHQEVKSNWVARPKALLKGDAFRNKKKKESVRRSPQSGARWDIAARLRLLINPQSCRMFQVGAKWR